MTEKREGEGERVVTDSGDAFETIDREIQAIEEVQPSAARQHALDDLPAERDLVHQNFSTQGLRSTSKLHAERCCPYTAI